MAPAPFPRHSAVVLAALILGGCSSPLPSPRPTPVAHATPTPIPLARTVGWSGGPAMNAARAFHAAARLSDGTVLLVGSSMKPLAFAELYDPATDSFRQSAALLAPQTTTAATLLPDGRVLVAGGYRLNAEIYDPSTGQWSLTGSMVGRRRGHPEIVLQDGRVLAVGGDVSSIASKTVEAYNPATDSWSPIASMAGGRVGHTLALLPDGRVLVAGGQGSFGSAAAMDTVEFFDPSTNTFALGPSMLHPRAWHTATVLVDGGILLVGGSHGNDVLRSAEIFDPATGAWTEVASTNAPHASHTATLLPGGRVLVAGGTSSSTPTAEIYDAAAGRWLGTTDMLAMRTYHTATMLLDGRVLIAGGIDDSNVTLASSELWLEAPLPAS